VVASRQQSASPHRALPPHHTLLRHPHRNQRQYLQQRQSERPKWIEAYQISGAEPFAMRSVCYCPSRAVSSSGARYSGGTNHSC
jgi:hypothetical protein